MAGVDASRGLGRQSWRRGKAGMKEIGEEMEGRRGGEGSLCGFESTVQRLPDKLVFPGTPQER